MKKEDIISIDDREKYAKMINEILNRTLTITFLILFNLDIFYTSHLELKLFVNNRFLFNILYIFDVVICMFIIYIWIQNIITKGAFTYSECFKLANKHYINNIGKKTTPSE